MARLAWCLWIAAAPSLVMGCATQVPFAAARDANADAPWDPNGPHPGPGPRVGGPSDAGHDAARDASLVSGGCAPRILVVFDRSLSMQTSWNGSGPRWQVAQQSLASALTPHEAQLTVGAILFPSSDLTAPGDRCAAVDPIDRQIPFEACPTFLVAWSTTWSTPRLLGSTPIDTAFDAADAALTGAGAETAVVLLTDGEPTCTGSVDASRRAATWHTRGISTWVVGLPGSEAGTTYLDAIARAGGTTAPLSVDDPSALSTALGNIARTQVESQCGH
jgi:hypothetical protein